MKKFPALLLVLMALALPGLAAAADPTIPDDTMKPYRVALHGDLRQFYADRLMLNTKDGEDFWPIYNEYAAEQKALDDRVFMLLQRYANAYKQGSLTDRQAKPLLKEAMAIEQDEAELRAKIIKKAKKVLPPFKAALFFQIDARVRIASRYERALQVPVID